MGLEWGNVVVVGEEVVENFEGEEEYFEADAMFDEELQSSVMVKGHSVSEEASSRVMNLLGFMECLGSDAIEKRIKYIQHT